MLDYRKMYCSSKGACASCRHIRTRICEPLVPSRSFYGRPVSGADMCPQRSYLAPWDGSRIAACVRFPAIEIRIRDIPTMEFPIGNTDCWEPENNFVETKTS